MAAALAGTAGGLYLVFTQDLGHGPGHDQDHHAEAHETHGKNEGEDDSGDDEPQEDSNDVGKGMAQGGPKDDTKSKTSSKPAEERDDEQPEEADKPGAGRPDKRKSGDASGDKPKNDEPNEASPDKSDKVFQGPIHHDTLRANYCSPTPAASPRAPTKPPASKRVSPTPTHTTAHKSPSRTIRAKRARVSLRPPSSRAPFLLTAQELRIRKSEERPSKTRKHRANALVPPNCHVSCSTPAATNHLAAPCIVCKSTSSVLQDMYTFTEEMPSITGSYFT
jgi:hypothetical protein